MRYLGAGEWRRMARVEGCHELFAFTRRERPRDGIGQHMQRHLVRLPRLWLALDALGAENVEMSRQPIGRTLHIAGMIWVSADAGNAQQLV